MPDSRLRFLFLFYSLSPPLSSALAFVPGRLERRERGWSAQRLWEGGRVLSEVQPLNTNRWLLCLRNGKEKTIPRERKRERES